MKKIHGHIFCGGIGSRWGGTSDRPYPKHLEKINGMTVLELNIRFLKELGINNISIELNPLISDMYIQELIEIEKRLNVTISYTITDSEDSERYIAKITESLKSEGLTRLDGTQIRLAEDQVILGLQGDSVIVDFAEGIEPTREIIMSQRPTGQGGIHLGGYPCYHILPMAIGILFTPNTVWAKDRLFLPLTFQNLNEPKDKESVEEYLKEYRENARWILEQTEGQTYSIEN